MDPQRLVAASRDAVRALMLVPLLALPLAVHVRVGSDIFLVACDLAVTALIFEIALRLTQWRERTWPFSRPWESPPDELMIGIAAGSMPIVVTVLALLVFVYDRSDLSRAITCALLGFAVILIHRAAAASLGRTGLRLEIAPAA